MKELINDIFDIDEMMEMDGYSSCIVGVVERFGQPPIICYDKDMVVAKLMECGMDADEAYEYFEYNQIGAWVGEATPCFLTKGAV